MSKGTTRIYHGGPANTGSGGSGYSAPSDRLLDQLGSILMQGISNVVHLITGKTITADQDMNITVVRDFEMNVARYFDIISLQDAVIDLRTSLDQIVGEYYDLDVATDLNIDVGQDRFLLIGRDSSITITGRYQINGLKSGATQAAAGAILDELWVTAGHGTLPDGVVMKGL